MPTARVVAVAPGSPAAEAGVLPGDDLVAVNGEHLRDVIRYQVQADEPLVELDVLRGGIERRLVATKSAGAPLGLEVESAVFDRVRTCDNHCPFCFIYQLPKGMRRSLYLKDDDYRLSFLYGNFTTLTRFTEADLERVITEQLGPLYVSIHATDPEMRARLLRNRRGATSLRWLSALLGAGIEVHGQVVVCPGLNDGEHLDDTMLGLMETYSKLSTVGVVPLGVSSFSTEPDMRAHTTAEAIAVVEQVERWQERFLSAVARRMVFAADEYYLMAGLPFPEAPAYEAFAQHENGIGMARVFEREVRATLAGHDVDPTGPRAGFFSWVDGAPAEGYRAPRRTGPLEVVDARKGRPIRIVTGAYGVSVLTPLLPGLSEHAGVPVELLPVENEFFGGNIGVTGLLTGADVARALEDVDSSERVLLPDVVLSEDRFLDGATVADLPRPVEVVPTNGVALVSAIGGS
jgi:putative radical SAM enzyme (TIGR03279 family)